MHLWIQMHKGRLKTNTQMRLKLKRKWSSQNTSSLWIWQLVYKNHNIHLVKGKNTLYILIININIIVHIYLDLWISIIYIYVHWKIFLWDVSFTCKSQKLLWDLKLNSVYNTCTYRPLAPATLFGSFAAPLALQLDYMLLVELQSLCYI